MSGSAVETRIKHVRAPWSKRVFALLADGDWHVLDEVLNEAAREVPPGVAFRYSERERNDPVSRPNGPGPRQRGDDSTSIQVGARRVVQKAILCFVRGNNGSVPLIERSAQGLMIRLARSDGPRSGGSR